MLSNELRKAVEAEISEWAANRVESGRSCELECLTDPEDGWGKLLPDDDAERDKVREEIQAHAYETISRIVNGLAEKKEPA
jgi:hypothetical protein